MVEKTASGAARTRNYDNDFVYDAPEKNVPEYSCNATCKYTGKRTCGKARECLKW